MEFEFSYALTPEVIADVKVRCPQAVVTLDNPQGFIDAVKP